MAWREKMGSDSLTKNPQNPQKVSGGGGFESIGGIEYRIENKKGYPVPTIEVDAGPVAIKMNSGILGATVDVLLWPDKAEVDGCEYSNAELVDLLSRGISHDALREVHIIKHEFEGVVVPSKEVEKLEPISKW